MSDPRAANVSVIVPAYNSGTHLSAAIDSVLAQTLPPHQVIVVDDGSTDDTPARCAAYGDRITYVRKENAGTSEARNTALGIATGEYVALLDHDDLCAPDRLEKQAAALHDRPDAIACFSGHWVFSEAGRSGEYPGDPSVARRGTADFICRVLVHPCTVMYRRAAAGDLRFSRDASPSEDMIFIAQLRHRGPVLVLPDVLYGYRRHPSQITARWTEIGCMKRRLEWAERHGARAWPGLDFATVERTMWRSAAGALATHYWARRRGDFLALRADLRREWPAHLERPPELDLRWYPDWAWRLRGRLGDVRRRVMRRPAPATRAARGATAPEAAEATR